MPAIRGLVLWAAVVLFLLRYATAHAADPAYARVSFQGRLADTNGHSVADGAYDMAFKFYNAPVAGTLLLTDRHSAGLTGGLYSVLLGGGQIVAGTESNLWNVFLRHPEVYLGVSINTEPEMSPRWLL